MRAKVAKFLRRMAPDYPTYRTAKRAHKQGRDKEIGQSPPRRTWAEVQAAWQERKRRAKRKGDSR